MSEPLPVQPQPAILQIAPACCCQTNKKSGFAKFLRVVFVLSLLLNAYLIIGLVVQVALSNTPEKALSGDMPINYTDHDRIVVLDIKGAIDDAQAAYLAHSLDHLNSHPPAALVLRIDSPGGGVSASDQMHHALMQFRAKNKNVKVIASFGGIAASGGYYIAMPCDALVCENTGITGSIGVIAQIPALGGIAKKLGIEMNTVIADGSPHKADANDLFVSWYDESGALTPQGKAAKEVLGGLLNSAYGRFYEVVKEGRLGKFGATEEEIKAFANGKIYTADQALELKVIDQVGYLEDAIERARKEAGLKSDAPVSIIRHEKGGFVSRLLGGSSEHTGIDVTNIQPAQVRDMLSALGGVKLEYRMDFPVK